MAYSKDISDTWNIVVGATFENNSADGSDFDYDGHLIYVSSNHRLTLDHNNRSLPVALSIFAGYQDTDYDNPNSFTGFTAARYDEQLSFSVSARFPINERINGFAQISHLDNDSNIPVYDYDQNRILFGVEFSQQRNR